MDDTKPPKAKGFFSLLSEVRNQIYALLFEYNEPLHIVLDGESARIGLHRRESGGAGSDGDGEGNRDEEGENNEHDEENGDQGDQGEGNDGEEISDQACDDNDHEGHENND
jgi:hypothetical protein